jgi:hypothetical protein
MNRQLTMARILRGNAAPLLLAAFLLWPARIHSAVPPQPVLVELFTSEGCSSCPPADRLLMELDRDQPVSDAKVIVLSEHVDYWNHLGWRDPFSSAQWSQRQGDYARHFGLDSVYTPQMVIDGSRQAVGNDSDAVRRAIQLSAQEHRIAIRISDLRRVGDRLRVTYSAAAAPDAILYAVLADATDHSIVARGENAGRTLDHVAVARSLAELVSLRTAAVDKTAEIALPPDDDNRRVRLILFARDSKTGAIAGVAEREI